MMKPYYLPLSFFVCHLFGYFFLPCVTARMDDWNSTTSTNNNCSFASMFLITNSSAYMEASEQWILHMGELCTTPTTTRCGPPMCTFTNVTNATTIHWTLTLDFPPARILRNDEYMNRMNQECVNAGGKVVYSDYHLQLWNFNYTTFAFHHRMEIPVVLDPTLVQVLDVVTTGMPDCVDPVYCTNRTTVSDFITVEWATYNDAVVTNLTMTNMTWDTSFAKEEDGLL